MCGPIAMMLPVDHKNEVKKIIQILTYHIGRLTAYATIGLIFGLLGRGFNDNCCFDSGKNVFQIQFFKACL
jgi:sulfite exporter TauE/SafE